MAAYNLDEKTRTNANKEWALTTLNTSRRRMIRKAVTRFEQVQKKKRTTEKRNK